MLQHPWNVIEKWISMVEKIVTARSMKSDEDAETLESLDIETIAIDYRRLKRHLLLQWPPTVVLGHNDLIPVNIM